MSTKLVSAPNAPYGLPVQANAGLNDQQTLEAVNNSGTWLRHGDVVCWDTNSALSAVATLLVSGAQTATVASFTLTANASTASFPAVGSLIVQGVVSGAAAAANLEPIYISYTGIAGSTFTGAKAHKASVTNGLLDAISIIHPWPSGAINPGAAFALANNYKQPIVSFAAAPADGGRLVTLSATGAVLDPKVAGVVTADGTAATLLGASDPAFPGGLIAPGQTCLIAHRGIARVNINAETVAAGSLVATATAPGGAQSATPATIGTLIGVAMESQAAKDANNTIRVKLCLA